MMMYALLQQLVYALTWVLFWWLFSMLLHSFGNKHYNNTPVTTQTVYHCSPCIFYKLSYVFSLLIIILYFFGWKFSDEKIT